MSVFKYNGIELPYCDIVDFSQDAVSDDSDTDWHLLKMSIKLQAIISPDYLGILVSQLMIAGDTPGTDSAADIMRAVRSRLMQRRRPLSFTFNGAQLIPNAIGQGTVDAKNGPIPQSCSIIEATNNTFIITYHIIAHYWENNDVDPFSATDKVRNKAGGNVLYNRWTETMDIDSKDFTRRTRQGKYIIRSDNRDGKVADELRNQMAVLAVPSGFLRDSSSYVLSPDGLGISYTIVDQEVFKMPPKGAYKADGEYIESATQNGAIRYGEVRVSLEGGKDTDQSNLILKAIAIAVTKLFNEGAKRQNGNNAGVNQFSILERCSVKMGLYDNSAEVQIRAMCKPGKKRVQGVTGLAGMSTFTPLSDGNPAGGLGPLYRLRGSANLLLQTAAYYDPSLTDNQLEGRNVPGVTNTNIPTADTSALNHGLLPGQAGQNREP